MQEKSGVDQTTWDEFGYDIPSEWLVSIKSQLTQMVSANGRFEGIDRSHCMVNTVKSITSRAIISTLTKTSRCHDSVFKSTLMTLMD